MSKNRFSTSPSIYVNFQGLNAGDACGTTYTSSTMIAFSSEELSTIAGHIKRFTSSQQFNSADLSYPPQSIMIEYPSKDELLCFSKVDTYSPRTDTYHYRAYQIVHFSPSPTISGGEYHFLNTVTRSNLAYSTLQERWSQGWR